jgi:hypothetical protein
MRLNEPARIPDSHWLGSFAWPTIHQIFSKTLRLLVIIRSIDGFFHAPSLFDTWLEILNDSQLVLQLLFQVLTSFQS